MKKYAKLLCSVLVLAALCVSFVFVASAEETEPFVKSFEAVDYSGKQINNGTEIIKSKVSGNRVNNITTMNPTNSPFVSIAQANPVSGDPYVVAYANQDYSGSQGSGNNLSISVETSKSAPFTVVGEDAQGYYVIDLDVSANASLYTGFNLSVVMRRASDNSGYPFSDEIILASYITETDSWSHVTIVGDIKNNVAKVYVNGVFVADAGKAVRNSPGVDNAWLADDTSVVAHGFRLELTRNNVASVMSHGDNVGFDNLSHRLFIEDSEDLQAAVESNDVTSWSGYDPGRGGEKLTPVVIVDGVEYGNFGDLKKVFTTNDVVDVEFLAEPFAPVDICVNANINTNGMDAGALFALDERCSIKSIDGNIISTTAPFVSNFTGEEHITVSAAANIVKYNHPDNLFSHFTANNYDVESGRAVYSVADNYTGSAYIKERVYSGTVDKNSNTYNGMFPSKIVYETGTDQHVVIDFDIAKHTSDEYVLSSITRVNDTNSSAAFTGNEAISLDSILSGYPLDEFVHITMVLSTDTQDTTIFVNGKYSYTKANNISYNTNHFFQCLRIGGNSTATVSYDNVCIRDCRDSTLTAAVENLDISSWAGGIYGPDYKLPTSPSKLIIDGEPFYTEEEIEAALYGNRKTPAVVKILNVFDETITVNCDARIYTYGQDVKFVDVRGNALVPNSDSVIFVDVPYMEVRSEQNISISGGINVQDIYNAIKSNEANNLFSLFVPSTGKWGAAGYRNASIVTNIDTGDVMYRDFAILNSDGEMNEDSVENSDMVFTTTSLSYEDGKSEYIVVDFDLGTDRRITDDVSIKLVSGGSGTDSHSGVLLKDLGIFDGDMAHVTVVFDIAENVAYAFVNGLYASTTNGIFANNESYLAGSNTYVDRIRLSSAQKTSPICLDNVVVRAFDYTDAENTVAPALNSGKITDWSGSVYDHTYSIPKLPTLAVVDGREYGSIDTLNKILSTNTSYVKNVEMKYCPDAPVEIRTEVTIETNGLDIDLDWNTGIYEFDPGVERYRGTNTGLAYASTKFIYTTVGTSYTFTTINADNCWNNASVAIWADTMSVSSEIVFDNYDVVFYPYGEVMKPIKDGNYIENGKLNRITWSEVIITDKTKYSLASVSEYPVASSTQATKIYRSLIIASQASYAATDMLFSANVSTDMVFNFYVNKNQTVTDTGSVATINGNEYVVFTYKLLPHEIDKVITVSFEVLNGGTTYTQKQNICFVDYISELLKAGEVDKSLLVSLLSYANEAHKLFDGDQMDSVAELISEYSEYLPTTNLPQTLDTSELSEIVRSAALRLNSTPEFVFKIARGVRGTMTLSYVSLGETVEHTVNINSVACEQVITLKGLNVYDVNADITISIELQGSDSAIVGQYNLATYAQRLDDNAFAVALYNYAKLALQHRSVVVDAALPV